MSFNKLSSVDIGSISAVSGSRSTGIKLITGQTPNFGVVTDGLQYHLDLSNPFCYHSDAPSTAYNLVRNGQYITMTGAAYDSDLGGCILSNATTQSSAGSTTLDFAGGGFTMSVWIKHTSINQGRVQRWFTVTSSPTEGPVMRHTESSGRVHCYIFDSGGGFRSITVNSQVVAGAYANFVFTGNGSNNYIYKNNTQVGTLAATYTLPTTTGTIVLGSGGEWLNGRLYIAQYYNKVLSTAERLQNYNYYRSRFGL